MKSRHLNIMAEPFFKTLQVCTLTHCTGFSWVQTASLPFTFTLITAVSSGSFGPRGKIIYGAAWPVT